MSDHADDLSGDGGVDRLLVVILRMGRHLRREAQRAGLSSIDAQILANINRIPGIGVSELAAIERISSPSMSVHVKRLIAEGSIARQDDAPNGDQRRVGLKLTQAGRDALERITIEQREWLAAQIAELPARSRTAIRASISPLEALVTLLEEGAGARPREEDDARAALQAGRAKHSPKM